MRNAKRWISVCGSGVFVLAALLTGCSRDPTSASRSTWRAASATRQGPVPEAAIQFETRFRLIRRFADAHYKLAQTAIEAAAVAERLPGNGDHHPAPPRPVCAHLDIAQPPDPRGQYNDARSIWICSCKRAPTIPTSISHDPITTPAPTNHRRSGGHAKGSANWIPPSDAYLNLAMLQMGGQQWDGAEASFKKAVDLSPSPPTRCCRWEFLQTRGRFPEASSGSGEPCDGSGRSRPQALSSPACTWRNKSGQAEEFLPPVEEDSQ